MELVSMKAVGWILILGFAMLVLGAIVAPSGAYEGSIEARRQVIESRAGRWRLSKVFDGLAAALPSFGFVLLAVGRAKGAGSTANTGAGLAFGLAGIVGILYVWQLAMNPFPLYDRTTPAPLSLALYGLIALGLLLFGVTFRHSELPAWLANLCIALPGLILGLLVLIRGHRPILTVGPEAGFGIAVTLYLVTLVVGIVLVRQPP